MWNSLDRILCPFCSEDELWIFKAVYYVEVKCYNCGLIHTIVPRPSDDDLDDAVAAIVAAALKWNGTQGVPDE